MSNFYKAGVVVGVPRHTFPSTHNDLIKDFTLSEFKPVVHEPNFGADIIGLEYAESNGLDANEFVWNDGEILTLKNKFLILTGLEAQVFICVVGY
jgi:hypothetical protein